MTRRWQRRTCAGGRSRARRSRLGRAARRPMPPPDGGRGRGRELAAPGRAGAPREPRARRRGRARTSRPAPRVRGRSALADSRQPLARLLRQRPRLQARSATDADLVDQAAVEPVPAGQERRVVVLGVPEDGKSAAVLSGPVEERAEPRAGFVDAEVEVALCGQSHVHRGKWNLDEVARRLTLEVPRTERVREPRPEADRVSEAEGRVVGEAGRLDRPEVSVRVDTQEVVTLAADRSRQLLEALLLARDTGRL